MCIRDRHWALCIGRRPSTSGAGQDVSRQATQSWFQKQSAGSTTVADSLRGQSWACSTEAQLAPLEVASQLAP
eukprot:13664424-Alexandrium_andersonii.AAC.1